MKEKSVFRSAEGKDEIRKYYSDILDLWTVSMSRQIINTSAGETFIISGGPEKGNPVLLLHGTGSNSAMWTGTFAALSKHYRVHAIDIPGECGLSSEFRPAWQGSVFAGWLNEVLDQLEAMNPVLVGCSLGAWIAGEYAFRFPGNSGGLVLLAPGGLTPVKTGALLRIMMLSFTGRRGFEKISSLVYGPFSPGPEVQNFSELVNKHFIPAREALPLFSEDDLRAISCPLCYLGGDRDFFYNSLAAAGKIERCVPHAEIHVLKNTGHVLDGNDELILRFIDNINHE